MLYFIFAFLLLALIVWVVRKMVEICEREEELDKYSIHLDERANKLAVWEEELKRREERI